MESEIIKQAFKLGNSAGVLLPVEWRDKKVAIKLIDKSITQELLEILDEKNLLKNTIGIFLAGSYARGEEEPDSDIDVLIVTDAINKNTKTGKYEITFISKDRFEKLFPESLYLASLIYESKAILNDDYLQCYKKKVQNLSIKRDIENLKSMMKVNEKMLALDKELEIKVFDITIYSLVLRLRELYLIESLKNNKIHSKKEFVNLVKKISSEECYRAYLRIKNHLKQKQVIPLEEAVSLLNEIKKRLKKLQNDQKK